MNEKTIRIGTKRNMHIAALFLAGLFLFLSPDLYADSVAPKAAPGRPALGRGTVLSDKGTLLRGPYWSIDIAGELPDRKSVFEIPGNGMNALHVYAERHDDGMPAGSYMEQVDTLVRWCGEAGLYCVVTIGCGNHNGAFDSAFARAFWEIYAPRYKKMPWVIYEIHNEPFSWQPPYDKATLKMEQEMYDLIRKKAPDTMLLFFSYAGLDSTEFKGGPQSAVAYVKQDIESLDVDWNNAAVAFHGYGSLTDENLKAMKRLGISIINTEVPISSRYSNEQANAEHLWLCEKNEVSWFVFIQIKKGYIGGWRFRREIDNRKLGWKPDFGTWPDRPLNYVPRKNLAEGKPVTVSSVENFFGKDLLGKYAVDGDRNTRWGSAFADEQFLIVDLEQPTETRMIVINWESQYAVEYEVQISDDMENWKTVRVKKRGNGGGLHLKERIPFSYITRYIRLLTHKRRLQYGYSIYEFEVLGPE